MSIPRDSSSSTCVADVVPGRRIRGPLVTLQSWVTESHDGGTQPRVPAQSAAGTSRLVKLWDISRKAHLCFLEQLSEVSRQPVKFFLTDTGKSQEDVRLLLRTRAPREESLGSQRVICEEVEGKRSLLSKDRFLKVFCLTQEK